MLAKCPAAAFLQGELEKKESQAKPAESQPGAKPNQPESQPGAKPNQPESQPEAKPSQPEANQKSQPGFPLRALALQKQRQLLGILPNRISRGHYLQPHACTQRFRLRILRRTRSNAGRTSARSLSGRIYTIWETPSKERGAILCSRFRAAQSAAVAAVCAVRLETLETVSEVQTP